MYASPTQLKIIKNKKTKQKADSFLLREKKTVKLQKQFVPLHIIMC